MLKYVKICQRIILFIIFEQLKITDMKRKTLQEVMKMTEKERFMYYADLLYGRRNFSVSTTPGSFTLNVAVWDYLSSNEFDYTCIDVCYIRHADGIVLLEKYLDKWL